MSTIDDAPYAIIDDADPTVVRVRVVGALTDASFEAYLDDLWRAFERRRGRPFGVILDQGRLRAFPHRFLRRSSRWLSAAQEAFGQRWVVAFVLRNPLLRGTVRALFWASRSRLPVACFETSYEAEAWVRAQLRKVA